MLFKSSRVCLPRLIVFFITSLITTQCQFSDPYDPFLLYSSDSDSVSGDANRFYITLDRDYYNQSGTNPPLYELSDDDDIGLTECGINKDDDPSEDKYCILDINEMDILGVSEGAENTFPLKYNVPREMCEYTSFYIPWHWNQPTGYGPRNLLKHAIELQQQNAGGTTTDNDQQDENCEFYLDVTNIENLTSLCPSSSNASSAVCPSANSIGGLGWQRLDEEEELSDLFCQQFDLSKEGEDNYLANCCLGTYKVIDCSDGGEAEGDWGGNVKECIGGPLRMASWSDHYPDETLELPIPKNIYSWDTGVNDTFEITKAQIVAGRSGIRSPNFMSIHPQYASIGLATYYEGIEDLEWNSDSGCTNCPEFFFSSKLTYNDEPELEELQFLGYPYFTLECLDSDKEATHRVHLIIREWNTLEEFISFQDTDGRSGDPNVEGREGEDCDYYEADEFNDNSCNDLYDLDDIRDRKIGGCVVEKIVQGIRRQHYYSYPCADYGQSAGG